jgi:hypothetical protein
MSVCRDARASCLKTPNIVNNNTNFLAYKVGCWRKVVICDNVIFEPYQPVVEKVAVLPAVVVGVQDDVAVAGVELTVVLFQNLNNAKKV